ncbi:hypothetical protein NX059_007433 [Plenodomus lindquistii]|nr:hypothetical protein NX059_007433 [Plenodomus lindquistii]
MQGYAQGSEQQRPGSVAGFAGQEPTAPPLPPRTYAASQGYHAPAPNAHGQWTAAPPPASSSWAPQPLYPPQHKDNPPPPPPKIHGFAAAVHREQQYQQQQQYLQQQQHEWPQQAQPQPYSHAAPPAPSATPGASYFPSGPQYTNIPPPVNAPGAHAFAPSSAYTTPGAYASPPAPVASAWQHAQVGTSSSGYAQPYQDALSRHSQQILQPHAPHGTQPSLSYGQQAHNHYVPPANLPQHDQYTHHSVRVQPQHAHATPYVHSAASQAQWQTSPHTEQGDPLQRNEPWQPDQQTQAEPSFQQRGESQQGAPAAGWTDTTPAQYYSQPTPQSQPVSPIGSQQSISLGTGLHLRSSHDTASPAPLPLREDTPRFSALGVGGPSDWERLGGDSEEIDDEEAFSSQKEHRNRVVAPPESVELPAHVHSPPSTRGWPSPAQSNPSCSRERRSTYAPTPPPATAAASPYAATLPPLSTVHAVAMANGQWDVSQQTPTQAPAVWSSPGNERHDAQSTAKDEALERLRADAEQEKASLYDKIEQLKKDVETVKLNAGNEAAELRTELVTLKITSKQVAEDFAAAKREKDATIERMKEDVEGKEHNIDERDVIIADLKRQIEAERTKDVSKPTPGDLIPDIDPWYIGSLERYITMLRSEANEPQIEEKIKTFRAFCKAESEMRGIDYYATPPQAPSNVMHEHQVREQTVPLANASGQHQNLNVHVPQQLLPEEDNDNYDFSPGGRPILNRIPRLPITDRASRRSQINVSFQSTAILTPTSSVEGDTNKTPVQSPPEETLQPQYKAYVPPASVPDLVPLTQRAVTSSPSISGLSSLSSHSKGRDEVFFGAHKQSLHKTTSRSASSDSFIAVPAPLKFASSRPVSTAAPSKRIPSDVLRDLLPDRLVNSATSPSIDAVRTRLEAIRLKSISAEDMMKDWERTASLKRRKKDDARRKRQEENEEHNDELFNNEEITYAEMNQREEDFKREEGASKAKEDRDEYENYVDVVFTPIYETLHSDIKILTELRDEVESVLPTSVSGVQYMQNGDATSTRECLELLQSIHDVVETRHAAVVEVIAGRDKRYKKTELQPLYAAGDIARMKDIEKQYENAEKQAVLRAMDEKAERVAEMVKITEDVVIDAVSIEQGEVDRIITAISDLEEGHGNAELLRRAHDTLLALKSSSKTLLALCNGLEIALNDSVLEAEIAQVRADGSAAGRILELENEKLAGAAKMTAEYERRIAVLEKDKIEIEQLVRRKGGTTSED